MRLNDDHRDSTIHHLHPNPIKQNVLTSIKSNSFKQTHMKKVSISIFLLFAGWIAKAQINFEKVIGPGDLNADIIGAERGDIALIDVDNDSDLDLILSGRSVGSSVNALYLNEGFGNYLLTNESIFGSEINDYNMIFGDVDGDDDVDIFLSGYIGLAFHGKLFINNGQGNFTEDSNTSFDSFWGAAAFEDIDGDSDIDLLISGENISGENITKLYINDGTGSFTSTDNSMFVQLKNSALAFADFDNDGDQDLIISGMNEEDAPITKQYENDGSGDYEEIITSPFIPIRSGDIHFSDVDNDMDLDVIITGLDASAISVNKLYTNDGAGNYTEASEFLFSYRIRTSQGGRIAMADFNGDTYEDLIISAEALSGADFRFYMNDGSGQFNEQTLNPVSEPIVDLGDINTDGSIDIVVAGSSSGNPTVELLLNDGDGNFQQVIGSPFQGSNSGTVDFLDLDNDLDNDIIITGRTTSLEKTQVFINDGTGQFSEDIQSSFQDVWQSDLDYGDIDNDGDLDVFLFGRFSAAASTELYINDGSGIFTESTSNTFKLAREGAVKFFDSDADDDLDLIFTGWASEGYVSELYLNDGSGLFTIVPGTVFEGMAFSDIAIGDVDGDADLDVLITGINNSSEPNSILYINDGRGEFSIATGMPFSGVGLGEGSVSFEDIDGDNDIDLLLTTVSSTNLYLNDGTGGYTLVPDTPFETTFWRASTKFLDVENDGDADLILSTGRSFEPSRTILYVNDGNGQFSEFSDDLFIGIDISAIDAADIDNDGLTDVMITGQGDFRLVSYLYKNTTCFNTWYKDQDSDGFGDINEVVELCEAPDGYVANSDDCDDSDPLLNPEATWYLDSDGDGYGNSDISVIQCNQPVGYVLNAEDCDDDNADINPDLIWYADADMDGYGDENVTRSQCLQPTGFVSNFNDCDDTTALINPGTTWYLDADGDGFGSLASSIIQCDKPPGYVLSSDDCDDTDDEINPNLVWYADSDMDGYGDANVTLSQCLQPIGFVSNAEDCDDSISIINPGTIWYLDADRDGFGDLITSTIQCNQPNGYVLNFDDCDDSDANVFPDAPAQPDGKDNNCDGEIDRVPQEIEFSAIQDVSVDTQQIQLSASASSGLPVTFNLISGAANLDGNTLTLIGSGSISIEATQSGDDRYLTADPVMQTFNVTKVLSADNQLNEGIILYPNPSSDQLTISVKENPVSQLLVFNSAGQNWKSIDQPASELLINVSGWPSGTYFIHITFEGSTKVKKFIKR